MINICCINDNETNTCWRKVTTSSSFGETFNLSGKLKMSLSLLGARSREDGNKENESNKTNRVIKNHCVCRQFFCQRGKYCQEEVQLDCRSCGRTRIIDLTSNQKGYDNSETTVGKLSARRIQIWLGYFCLGIVLKVIQYNFQNIA